MPPFYNSPDYSYPVPDPSWDYCQTWHELQQIKKMLESLIEDMVFVESGNEHFDRQVTRTVERMREQLKGIAASSPNVRLHPPCDGGYCDTADEAVERREQCRQADNNATANVCRSPADEAECGRAEGIGACELPFDGSSFADPSELARQPRQRGATYIDAENLDLVQ